MSPSQPPKHRQCGAQQVNERLYEQDPSLRGRHREIEDECQQFISSGYAEQVRRKLTTLPVVVHVVHKTDEENISDEQVQSQIEALNKDYRAANPDRDGVPAPWKSLVADPNIQFELATKDPDGNATNGITRTQTDQDSFSTDDGVKSEDSGGISPWPVDEYLNLWACNLGGGLLGYAQFPGGPADTDGVVILYTAFGTSGVAADPFNLGRTATHEIGHFLNLRHIWGDTNDCSGSDQVSDTPRAQAPNYGKPDWPHITCNNGPNGDMFMDYMDYVDDAAMFMFTHGQAARMNATLAGPRKKLAGL
jgi:hypothetical protein